MIILMCLSAIITSTFLTYVLSEWYKSSTIVLIRPQETVDLVPKRDKILNFPMTYFSPIETASKTYTEIVKSRLIAERVTKLLTLESMREDKGAGWRYYWKKTKTLIKNFLKKSWALLKYGRIEADDPFNRVVSEIQGGLSVKPTKKTYLFEIEAEARSPWLASAVANASAKVFMDYLKEQSLHELENARQLSEEKVKQSSQKLEKAREALVKFKEREGVVSLREETALHLELLGELESSLKTVNTDINGVVAQKKEIARQLRVTKNFTRSTEKVIDNPILRDLKLGLAKKEVALKGLSEKFAPEHREIRILQAEIKEINKKIEQHEPTLNSEVTSTVNPTYQNLLNEQTNLENELESLKAKRLNLSEAIEKKKKILGKLPFKEARLANLKLAISLQEQTHELLNRESEELKMAATRRAPDIQMMHPAVTPVYPSRPIKIYHAGLAAILSLIVGVGVALLKENMNLTIRSAHEAEQALSLPVLMTVPQLALPKDNQWPLILEEQKELPEVIRKHKRIPLKTPIEVTCNHDRFSTKGKLIDISMGGACFDLKADNRLYPDETVILEIPNSRVTAKKDIVKGIVVRSENASDKDNVLTTAIEFINLNESMTKEIMGLIHSQNFNLSFLLPSDFEEPIRGLRSDVQFYRKDAISSFLITSSVPQEGKSTIAANIGLSLVAIKKSVILVDAHLRHPSLHKMFGLSKKPGLLDVLSQRGSLLLNKTPSGLSILTSGPLIKDPAALIGSGKMKELIDLLKKDFDFVLIDAPPLLSGPDTALLASITDGVVIVIDTGRTTSGESKRAKSILEKSNAKILGVVMNNYNSDYEGYYKQYKDYSKA
jgi:capsular exopolysaccharide synthesis family protein